MTPTNEYDQRPQTGGAPARETINFADWAKLFPKWTELDLQTIWEMNEDIHTAAEFRYFLTYAREHGLSPILGEVIGLQRYNAARRRYTLTPIVTIGVLRRLRAKECDGLDQFQFENDGNNLISAAGTIYRKGAQRPFSATVYFDEYAAFDSKGALNTMWATKKHMLLSKVLEAHLTRLAFFDLCGDMLVDEETQQAAANAAAAAAPAATEFKVAEKEATPAPATDKPVDKVEDKPADKVADNPTDNKPVAAAESVKPEPQTATATTQIATESAPDFAKVLDTLTVKLGGTDGPSKKNAQKTLTRYIGSFVDIPPNKLPKDREKLLPALLKLLPVADARLADLQVDPEGLGIELAGRKKSRLDEEMGMLRWPPAIRELAKKVMAFQGMAPEQFVDWLQLPIAGDNFSVASMDMESLSIFFPLYLLVKGDAFVPVDYAVAQNKPVGTILKEMVEGSGCKSIDEWNAELAKNVVATLASLKDKPATSNAPPPADNGWDNSGLPFED